MLQFDAASAECLVFVYKEGLLARVAHDLKIRVTKFRIDADETARTVQAWFDTTSLRTVSAMVDGVPAVQLSASDCRQIDTNIVDEVLDARRYPQIAFASTSAQERGDRYTIRGTLDLHGTSGPVVVRVHREGEHWIAAARLHQPDFGIRPYTALLGTLRVQPDVDIRVIVPAQPT